MSDSGNFCCCYLPEPVLILILLRLPVRSLLRFHSVCRTWRSIIISPHFISNYKNNRYLKFVNQCRGGLRGGVSTLLFLEGRASISIWREDQPLEDRVRVEWPIRLSWKLRILGCCNGLICGADEYMGSVIVWNPSSISECIKIPSEIGYPYYGWHAYGGMGFGFDSISRDYKVVSFRLPSEIHGSTQGRIYSLNEGRLKRVRILCIPPGRSYDVDCSVSAFINGCINWICCMSLHKDEDDECSYSFADPLRGFFILMFDVHAEFFGTMLTPLDPVEVLNEPRVVVGEIRDCLALYCYQMAKSECHCVWVMTEYGVVESWTKLFNVKTLDYGGMPFGMVVMEDDDTELKSDETDLKILGSEPIPSCVRNRIVAYLMSRYPLYTYVESSALVNRQ